MSKSDKEEYGPWKLGKCIGSQESGSVFRGFNKNTGEIVSIKKIPLENIQEIHEISFPNLIKVFQVLKTDKFWIVIFENIENGSLFNLIQEYGKLEEGLVSNYSRQILHGLVKLESLNLKHGNLKTQNTIIRQDGSICLLDFGFKNSNGKTDLFNLGCMIVEMISGESSKSLHLKLFRQSPEIPGEYSGLLSDFLVKCWARKDSERWNATQLLMHPWICCYDRKYQNCSNMNVSWDSNLDNEILKRGKSVDLDIERNNLTVDRSKSLDLDRLTLSSIKSTKKTRSVCQIS